MSFLLKIFNKIFSFFIKFLPTIIFIIILSFLYIYITKDGLKSTEKHIKVQIEGAVKSPGIKDVKSGSIIKDIIEAAGGFSDNADQTYITEKINLVKKVNDGDKFFIQFKKTEVLSATESISISGKININKADSKQLDLLPGVGPATAQKIISGRPYSNIKDLITKKIVSTSTFNKIESQIEI